MRKVIPLLLALAIFAVVLLVGIAIIDNQRSAKYGKKAAEAFALAGRGGINPERYKEETEAELSIVLQGYNNNVPTESSDLEGEGIVPIYLKIIEVYDKILKRDKGDYVLKKSLDKSKYKYTYDLQVQLQNMKEILEEIKEISLNIKNREEQSVYKELYRDMLAWLNKAVNYLNSSETKYNLKNSFLELKKKFIMEVKGREYADWTTIENWSPQ